MAGAEEHGFTLDEGVRAAVACIDAGIESIELSHALGMPAWVDKAPEPPFLPMAEAVRAAIGPDYPLALVNGFRNLSSMEAVLESGVAQLISLCRPLIVEPDLPRKLRDGISDHASCASCSQCWPKATGEGTACHNRSVRRRLALPV